jgi:hypothetical protein
VGVCSVYIMDDSGCPAFVQINMDDGGCLDFV